MYILLILKSVYLFQMVFYVEACESGSMFDQTLPKNIKGSL